MKSVRKKQHIECSQDTGNKKVQKLRVDQRQTPRGNVIRDANRGSGTREVTGLGLGRGLGLGLLWFHVMFCHSSSHPQHL